MKKLIEVRWYIFGTAVITALVDLWTLPGTGVSGGFILLLPLLAFAGIYSNKLNKEVK